MDVDTSKSEMERLSFNRLKALVKRLGLIINEHRSLVHREVLSASILAETAVIGDESVKILCSGLHTENDRTMHECDILVLVLKRNHCGMHREINIYDITLLPLPVN